eukprot:Nk52_evm43s239 gene=Nk52_evmTU43s239
MRKAQMNTDMREIEIASSKNKLVDDVITDPLDANQWVSDEDLNAPEDRFNIAYFIFFFQGVGIFFPWNMFITGNQYYKNRLEGSSYVSNFDNYQTLSYQICNLTVLILATKYQHSMNVSYRVILPLCVQLILFVLTTAFIYIDMSATVFFAVMIGTTCISGLAVSFPLSGIFGLANTMPKHYVQALMAGEGLGGLTVAVSSLVSLLVGGTNDSTTYLIFFLISVVVIFLCIVSYIILLRMPIVKYYYAKYEAGKQDYKSTVGRGKASFSFRSAFKKLYYLCFILYFNFLITLSAFPTVTTMIEPTAGNLGTDRFFGDLWLPLYCFISFNLFDYIGRTSARWFTFPGIKNMWMVIVFRSAFIPLFMLCNIPSSGFAVFTGEAWPIIFMVVFAFTNGYTAAVTMMSASSMVSAEERDVAGAITVFFLQFGVASGCLLAFGWKAIICGCNSFVG